MFSSIPLRLEAEGDAEALDHVSRAGGCIQKPTRAFVLKRAVWFAGRWSLNLMQSMLACVFGGSIYSMSNGHRSRRVPIVFILASA